MKGTSERRDATVPARHDPNLREGSSAERQIRIGRIAVVGGFGAFVLWLAFANLSGAVVANGVVVAESDLKKVQHQTGGIVGAIHVRNGKRVAAGDLLVRLDDTMSRTTLQQVIAQLTYATARRARLEAERDSRETLILPDDFNSLSPDAPAIAVGEQRLLTEDRSTREQQSHQLRERIDQQGQEIEGHKAQIASASRQIELIRVELAGVQQLYSQNLVPIGRLTVLQREEARLEGEIGSLKASIAKAASQIAELNLQLLTIAQKARADAVKDLRDIEGQIAQLVEKRVAALDILGRIEIRAPQSGFVHEMTVHTVGGVIAPGEAIMQIVPDKDRLAVEIRVNPQDISHVHLGQRAVLRLPSFNQRTTPELFGTLTRVAADVTRETQTGQMYYVARATVEENELAKLKGLALLPGMPVEAFVETGNRAAWSYFSKPLTDAFTRSFREE